MTPRQERESKRRKGRLLKKTNNKMRHEYAPVPHFYREIRLLHFFISGVNIRINAKIKIILAVNENLRIKRREPKNSRRVIFLTVFLVSGMLSPASLRQVKRFNTKKIKYERRVLYAPPI